MTADREALVAEVAGVALAWFDAHCRNCHKPIATEDDWQKYEGGEGEHLCWGDRDYCGFGCDVPREIHLAHAFADLVAAREQQARAAVAEAQQCGGCKGQGSHRRHCPRHPTYHPWIPLADTAERIGDSIGEPGLANRAWALAGAIRDEMPHHPYRPVRLRQEADA